MALTIEGTDCVLDNLERLFVSELIQFEENYDQTTVPAEQELRAGVICCIATFIPEAISQFGRRRLLQTRKFCYSKERTTWFRLPFIEVALFQLYGNKEKYLSRVISGLDQHNSRLRSAIYTPLALIAPKLSIHDFDLISRIESFLKHGYLSTDSALSIFCALKDSKEEKIEIVKDWKCRFTEYEDNTKLLDSLADEFFISNGFISHELSEIFRYFMVRLIDPNVMTNEDSQESPQQQVMDLCGSVQINTRTIWDRMDSHPLIGPYICL